MSEDNKTVKQIKSELKNLIYDEMQNLPESLIELEPKERLEMLVKLMPCLRMIKSVLPMESLWDGFWANCFA